MINFPCLCGVKFSLDDKMAGEMFQCKSCGRLVVVPTLDDLQHIKADGTYDLDFTAAPPKHRRQDPAAAEDQPPTPPGGQDQRDIYKLDTPRVAPRYDPFTGELIRPLEVEEEKTTAAAQAPLGLQPLFKSNRRQLAAQVPPMAWLTLLGEMFMTRNATVLVVMILIHALAAFLTFIVIGLAFAFFFVVPLVMLIACVGYYSILVQEIGPGEKDELPVPLRGFELRTDVWDPFVHIFFSAVACFGPAALAQIYCGGDPRSHLPVIALAAAGAFFLPAVFLTACVDGVLVNFRPDRVLGVIGKSLGNYLLIAVAWSAGTVMLVDGIVGCYEAGSWLFAWPGLVPYRSPHVFGGLGSLAMIAGGLYLSYYACWMLAIFWRKHHAEFPWIARRFVSEKPASGHPPAPLEKTAPVPPRHTS